MWMILGVSAIVSAILNIVWWLQGKDPKWFRFISLSLTALTLCAQYSLVGRWVNANDWVALMDVVPSMDSCLWFLTIASILINGVTLFSRKKN